MIKTIIFDLGGVYFSDGTKATIDHIHNTFSVSKAALLEVFEGLLGSDYRRGIISPENFWKKATEVLRIQRTSHELQVLWMESYTPKRDTIALIVQLKSMYELLFLSDNAPDRVELLEKKYSFLQHFKEGVFSFDLKVRKPDLRMYTAILEKTKSAPSECIYIDDKKQCLPPAAKLGMKTIHFKNAHQLEIDLKQLGVLF